MIGLAESRAWCRAVMRNHAKSFFFSTRALPRAKREAIEALYGMFRYADDAADEPGRAPAERRRTFAAIYRDLDGLRVPDYAGISPWFPAVRWAFEAFPIDAGDVRALVRGCESDIAGNDIATLADLEAYSARVAGTVGRCSLAVLGACDADSLARAERLGIAMQITNVLRDVTDDARLGRTYLPGQMTRMRSVRSVMAELADRAEAYYREADVLAERVPNDGSRVALLMTSAAYRGILRVLRKRGYDPRAERAYVPWSGKLAIAARAYVAAYTGLRAIL